MIRSKRTVWMNLGLVGLLALTSACGDKKGPEEGKSKKSTSAPAGADGTGGTVVKLPKKCSELPLEKCDSVLGCKKDGDKCGDDSDLSAEKCGEKSGDDCQRASYCSQNMFGQCFDIEGAKTGECRLKSYSLLSNACTAQGDSAVNCGKVKAGNTVFCAYTEATSESCVPNSVFGGGTARNICTFLSTGGRGTPNVGVETECTNDIVVLKAGAIGAGPGQLANDGKVRICAWIDDACRPHFANANPLLGGAKGDAQAAADSKSPQDYCTAIFNHAKTAGGDGVAINIARWVTNHREACEKGSLVRGLHPDPKTAAGAGYSICKYVDPTPSSCTVSPVSVNRSTVAGLSEADCKSQSAFLDWVSL